MIVRELAGRLLFITQPDHAQLAGRIMERCAPLAAHARRGSILLACREHDDGWIEEDAAPTVDPDTGRPVDFMTAPARVKQGVWPRAIARLAGDPWAAALVAQHAITVYDRFRLDPEWSDFFANTEAIRDGLVRESERTLGDLVGDYPYVRLADLMSLTFCNGWTEENAFGSWRVRGNGPHVTVTPDAFGGESVPFRIGCRVLLPQTFPSDDALRAALRNAPIEQLAGTAGRAGC